MTTRRFPSRTELGCQVTSQDRRYRFIGHLGYVQEWRSCVELQKDLGMQEHEVYTDIRELLPREYIAGRKAEREEMAPGTSRRATLYAVALTNGQLPPMRAPGSVNAEPETEQEQEDVSSGDDRVDDLVAALQETVSESVRLVEALRSLLGG